MGKIGAAILGAIIGGFAAVAAIVFWFGWGLPGQGQAAYMDPTRADTVYLACENCDTTIELGDISGLPFDLQVRIEEAVQEVNWALSRNNPLIVRPSKSGRLQLVVPGC
ncbi:hypothetical protein VK792_11415 [Mesobacterium sp. TK19101]|uniref:Uncharacterized protein n=1 Tax=Mesobacterium hydrothermale TaxID=3111907 RepID=A0ABU6HKC3_9RHOB|nr:hypothetical protein [Mesobacterium sp. TK19101]MEC3861893.1 hypothetical protein [Mesobacterium sp. TK19101]